MNDNDATGNIEALNFAFLELVNLLGRGQKISLLPLTEALDLEAKAHSTTDAKRAALVDLSTRISQRR